jgi:serine/threonine protein kinase/Tol biopolymer transport system component
MALAPGFRLGPYEIIALLGVGGMGEVYRARDPRLDRDVAIKVLPTGFASDREYLRRFEQEARAVAALNHPNILAVYDVGEHQSAPYIVSELLEGETLRSRTSGPVPQRRALEYAQQIARGLAAAHERGIVHRDLKPENVFIKTDGSAKILDFGLAKLAQPHPLAAGGNLSTLAQDTTPGAIMGTVGYMAPEQVRGEAADHRSDIFAFGAILYEMLSGRRAFAKETSAETLTAILKEDPSDLAAVDRAVAPGLSRIVNRCLEKSPAARFQSSQDLAFALGQLETASGASVAVRPTVPRSSRWLPWVLFAGAALAWLITSVLWRMTAAPETPAAMPVRFQIQPPGPVSFTASGNYIAVSPDGRWIAFAAGSAGTQQGLWVQALDSLTATPLPGTERATQPFWSADSRHIGFFADGKLKRIAASGGPARTICDADLSTGAAWSQNGTIVVSSYRGPLMRVAAAGGVPVSASVLDSSRPDEGHVYPQFLPDGDHFLFYVRSTDPERRGIYVQSLGSTEARRVVPAESRFVYVPGYLVYGRDGVLMAHPFDALNARVTGDPIATADRIEQAPETGNIVFSGSVAGVLVYRDSSRMSVSRLVWRDRAGSEIGVIGDANTYRNPRLSPDGRRIAVELLDRLGNRDIWILDDRGTASRFAGGAGRDASPVWSRDGKRIAWQGNTSVYVKDVMGGREEVLRNEPWIPDDWLHDGTGLLYHPGNPRAVWLLPLAGPDRTPRPIVEGSSITTHARVSPDGQWVAFASTDSGTFQVYVQRLRTGTNRVPVSIEGGLQPKWRPDGRELFYLGLNGMLMSVPITLGESTVEALRPQPLFDTRIEPTTGTIWHQYDVSPDGTRFLLTVPLIAESAVTIVVNWPSLVTRQQ